MTTIAWCLSTANLASAEHQVDFNQEIRPLLSNSCLICHGPDQEERVGPRLDTQAGSREDLGGYAAVVPGDPDASELLQRLTTDDEDLRMPPEGKGRRLTESEVELVRLWIKQGANYAKHWAYQLPQRSELPKVQKTQWPRNAVDRFVLAKLEAQGLHPSERASKLALARRVALDLTGLPPTWEEAQQFVNDSRSNAYELYVDQQFSKSSFGERWARVWLDLARYADSAGYADDPPRTIWAYRDYVIRSLNANKSFDQFTIEQIAGDLLPNPTTEQLIATAFHRNTLTNNEGGTNDEEFRNVAVVDRVNTTMAVWMGTTMACAQCHTHKYDPITQEEYFQFFAFFNNTEDTDKRDERPTIEIWSDAQETKKQELESAIAALKLGMENPSADLEAEQAEWLAAERVEPVWEINSPASATARYRELKANEEGWIEATGDKQARDNYTLEFATEPGKLTALKLEVPAEQVDNFVLSQVRATWSPSGRKDIQARYVRVDLPGKNKALHLAELQAFSGGENVAAKGKAKQSSTGFGGLVSYVNDGNTDGDYANKSVSHTNLEKNPWIEIDFGAMKSIERVAVWNRTDGGDGIRDRLKGFKISLLDADHQVVWEQSPTKVPNPSGTYAPDGATRVVFATAFADFEQAGFPAKSVIGSLDKKRGWAVAPQQGKAHELTLVTRKPFPLEDGVLQLQLNHFSDHTKHLLDRFRISMTSAPNVTMWGQMPSSVREILRSGSDDLNPSQREQLASYFRTIAPSLEGQRKRLAKLQKELESMRPDTMVPVMRELAKDRRATKVQIRGNYLSQGVEVTEGTPAALHPLANGSKPDRMTLAKWLVAKDNPLTPRVIANRHWEEIFGVGIVQTSEEFGSQGELPSHPQLLDWLAVEFRESGWDLKHLLKLLVTSSTYQQSSVTTPELQQSDPFNRFYARGPRFRVSAEMVRDQTLFVSGLLSNKMYGPPVNPPQPELGLKAAFGSATDWKTSEGDDRYRRGIYTMWRRSSPYPSMAQFDAPNREVCTVRRIRTNTPLQALVTMNDPVYVEAAQSLARKMIEAGDDPQTRIEFAFHQCLIREPSDAELERLSRLASEAYQQYSAQLEKAKQIATDPLGDLSEEADVAEYAAWTVVCNVILNLDEMLMKR